MLKLSQHYLFLHAPHRRPPWRRTSTARAPGCGLKTKTRHGYPPKSRRSPGPTTTSRSSLLTSAARCACCPLLALQQAHHCRVQEITVNTTVKAIKDGADSLPPLRNPPLLETADDLATLSHLNEPSGQRLILCLCSLLTLSTVLHTIRNRYAQHSIYTYSGIVLIAVNPFQRVTLYGPEIIQAYSGRRRGDLEPHLFAIAEDAYTAMRKEGMGQTIIVSGERYVLFAISSRLSNVVQRCRQDRICSSSLPYKFPQLNICFRPNSSCGIWHQSTPLTLPRKGRQSSPSTNQAR